MKKGWTAAALVMLCAAGVYFAIYSVSAITASAPYDRLEGLPTFVIDAGHGGFDGGAVGVDGIVEKDINLSVAKKLYDLLRVNGFDAVLTRDTDRALHDDDNAATRKKKNSDIHNRMALAKSYDNAILLSIHQNKFMRDKYWGAQVFYGPKNIESQALGETMQARLVSMLQPENIRQPKACGDSVYLIYNAPMPSLLIECGFLSNPEEARLLATDEYQQKIAFTIFSGLMDYLGLEKRDTGEAPLPAP